MEVATWDRVDAGLVWSNTGSSLTPKIADTVRDIIAGREVKHPSPRAEIALQTADLPRFVGTYDLDDASRTRLAGSGFPASHIETLASMEIIQLPVGLIFKLVGQHHMRYERRAELRFEFAELGVTAEFTPDLSALELRQGPLDMDFVRRPARVAE